MRATEPRATRPQLLLAWLAVILVALFMTAGLVWYGLSAEVHNRLWRDILGRPGGPMTFRFVLQPGMAALAALWDGINDARLRRTPYLWSLLRDRQDRRERLSEAVISTARIVLLGLGMDAIYQYQSFASFYPGEAVLITLILAFIPYLLLRGPVARIAAAWMRGRS